MKKILLIMALAAIFALTGACIKKKTDTSADNVTTIGIGKIVSHPSLDAIEKGIEDKLKSELPNVKIDKQNANGDINTASSIAAKFKADKVDIAIGIATPMAVAIANTIKDKPVIFSGVTDPIAAHLVENMDSGYKNVNGVVDTIPIPEQINEFRKIYPFKKLGFIYSSAETNAVSMAKTTEKVCKDLGIEFVPATIANTSEVKQAAESLIGRVDAFYVVNDNNLVAGVNALLETAKVNKIPVFSGDFTSGKDGGVLYALGFDYYRMGTATGAMIIDILKGKAPSSMPVGVMEKGNPDFYLKLIDNNTAKNLGITVPDELIKSADLIIEPVVTIHEKNK